MSDVKPGLWLTSLLIWSEFDPSDATDQDLLFEADEGSAYPIRVSSTYVPYEILELRAHYTPEIGRFFYEYDDDTVSNPAPAP